MGCFGIDLFTDAEDGRVEFPVRGVDRKALVAETNVKTRVEGANGMLRVGTEKVHIYLDAYLGGQIHERHHYLLLSGMID